MRGLTLHEWKIINADDEVIGTILTSGKNRHEASEKTYHKFGAMATFLKIEHKGKVER